MVRSCGGDASCVHLCVRPDNEDDLVVWLLLEAVIDHMGKSLRGEGRGGCTIFGVAAASTMFVCVW